MALDKAVDSAKLNACLTAEANAIRAKTGNSANLSFDYSNSAGFSEAIAAIPQKVDESWHQCPQAVRDYLANVDYTGVPYTESSIGIYAPSPPVPSNTKPIGTTVDGVTFYNEVPDVKTPFATANKAGTLEPLDQVRWINSAATSNFRDIGGWACDGGTVKYGLIYRSGNPGAADEGLIINQLGINTEIDLTADETPYSSKMRFVGYSSYAMYSLSNPGAWTTNLRGVFDAVLYRDPVLIHCSMGADRTGTLICILEGLLGMSQSDIDKDYELTSFYSLRARNGNYQGGTADWAHLISAINALAGSTFRDKCVTFALSLGFTIAEINAYRAAMIDGNPGAVTAPTVAVSGTYTNCSTSNSSATAAVYGAYSATITADSGYTLTGATVSVTMGGVDITSTAYSNGTISISSVTGAIGISVAAVAEAPANLFDKNDTDVVDGARFNSSHVPTSYGSGQLITGFIPVTTANTITVVSDKAQNTNNYTGVAQVYDASKTYLGSYSSPGAAPSAQRWVWSADYLTGQLNLSQGPNGGTNVGAAYIRFCLAYTDIDNIIITKS